MIVLAGLLWMQVVLLSVLGASTIYMSSKDRYNPGKIATVSGLTFGFFIGVSVWAALTVGGLA